MNKQQLIIKINYYIGIILFYLRFYKKANENFSKFLKINNKNSEAYNFRGMTFAALGLEHSLEAINYYIIELKLTNKGIYPDYPICAYMYMLRGQGCYELKKYEDAISDFTEVIKLDLESKHGDATVYNFRGMAYG